VHPTKFSRSLLENRCSLCWLSFSNRQRVLRNSARQIRAKSCCLSTEPVKKESRPSAIQPAPAKKGDPECQDYPGSSSSTPPAHQHQPAPNGRLRPAGNDGTRGAADRIAAVRCSPTAARAAPTPTLPGTGSQAPRSFSLQIRRGPRSSVAPARHMHPRKPPLPAWSDSRVGPTPPPWSMPPGSCSPVLLLGVFLL
jgi:hypothetical protein